mgnify:CR=1 FL=1
MDFAERSTYFAHTKISLGETLGIYEKGGTQDDHWQ